MASSTVVQTTNPWLRSSGIGIIVALATLAMLVLPVTYPAFAGADLETPFVALMAVATGLGHDCVRSFYLTQTPELTRYFCAHPERFLPSHVGCSDALGSGAD